MHSHRIAVMARVRFAIATLALALGGCSYLYNIEAIVRDGKVVFVVEGATPQSPVCVRSFGVRREQPRQTVWGENIAYEDPCENKFPVTYGIPFKGRPLIEGRSMPASPLQVGVTYSVHATTGANGYGSGRFVLLADGSVRNVK